MIARKVIHCLNGVDSITTVKCNHPFCKKPTVQPSKTVYKPGNFFLENKNLLITAKIFIFL